MNLLNDLNQKNSIPYKQKINKTKDIHYNPFNNKAKEFTTDLKSYLTDMIFEKDNNIDKETAQTVFDMVNRGKGCQVINLIRNGLKKHDKDWLVRYCREIANYKKITPGGLLTDANTFCSVCNHICCNKV